MVTHKDSARLKTRMRKMLPDAIAWSGVCYRSTSTRYASSSDILTGVGSQISGVRWNPLGSFPTVYLSLEPDTAFAEAFAHISYFGFQPQDALPRTFVATAVKLHQILDLTDQKVLKRLRLSRQMILHLDWRTKQDGGEEALTQAIGRLAKEIGFEGLLVPSAAAKHGKNLIFFPGSLVHGSKAKVLNPQKLKPLH